jgi:adenylate cyclase
MRLAYQKALGALSISLVVSALVCAGLASGYLLEVENRTWDARVRFVAEPSAHNKKIKIIAIDQTSLDRFARHEKIFWPWPRSLYNPVLLYLKEAGARAVGFDMLFTENSSQVEDDREFAGVIGNSLPVVSAIAVQESGLPLTDESVRMLRSLQSRGQEFARAFLNPATEHQYNDAAIPFAELLEATPYVGSVTAKADSDQIFRRTWPGVYLHDIEILSLPFALYQAVGGTVERGTDLRRTESPDGSLLMRFFGPATTYDTFSIQAIIESWVRISEGREPVVPLSEFKDAIVLIGTVFPGHFDLRPVPFAGNYPGVEFNATALDNLLDNSFMREVSLSVSMMIGCALVFLVALTSFARLSQQVGLSLLLALLWFSGCFYVAHLGWWMPLVWPFIGLVVATSLVFLLGYQLEGRQHIFIKRAFKHYVSPEVIDQIVDRPESLAIGGERRELTIFFSDIQGFTSLSEKLEPARLVKLLNRFLSEVSSIVMAHGGTIDKYQGDAVIAFWNAPLPVAEHARKAIEAAVACNKRLRELEASFVAECGSPLKMRIGLHTGEVSVGNFGSSTRFNYTMIGDAANLASRLEGVNKVFGTYVALSAATALGAPSIECRKLGEVQVVGRDTVVEVYEPLAVSAIRPDELALYKQALDLFEQGRRGEAREIFVKLPGDAVSSMYCKRIDSDEGADAQTHVWRLSSK